MKKIVILIFIIASTVSVYAQERAFYVAKYLNDLSVPETKTIPFDAQVASALKPFFPAGTTITIDVLNKNPFFNGLFEDAPGAGLSAFLRPTLNKVAGIDVTKIANGIADLMIERSKQELTIAFFDRFAKFAEKNPEFKVLFPKTTENLHDLLSYTYPQMLPVLRNGFFDDLKQLTYNLEAVLELERYKILLANFPEVRVTIRSLRIIHDLENSSSNAADIIRDFARIPDLDDPNGSTNFRNMNTTLKLTSILSESLRGESANVWVTPKEAKALIDEEVFTKVFLGLIYQQISLLDLKFHKRDGSTENVADLFAAQKDNLFFVQNRLSQFLSITGKVNESIKDFEIKKAANQLSDEDYFNYINVSLDAIEFAFQVTQVIDDRFAGGEYIALARKSNNLYKNLYSKEYTEAVTNGVEILIDIHDLVKSNTKVSDAVVKPAEKTKTLESLINFVDDLKPFALFMANIVEANTSDEVKAALDNVILPVGSSSIKKNTDYNLSIQSYLGARWTASDLPNEAYGAWSDKFGVSAPIGLSWTPGKLSWQRGGSLSLFVPLFDLGAIVDYKLKRDSVVNDAGDKTTVLSKDYSIKLGQIVSPGVYVVYGFFENLPLSIGFGGQYGPGLSKIDSNNETISYDPSWRWNFFLSVDLPFYNLVNKTKRPVRKN